MHMPFAATVENESMIEEIRELFQTLLVPQLEGIKGEVKAVNTRIDALDIKFDTKIDALETRLDTRIDALETRLDTRIDALETKLDTRIDALETKLDAR